MVVGILMIPGFFLFGTQILISTFKAARTTSALKAGPYFFRFMLNANSSLFTVTQSLTYCPNFWDNRHYHAGSFTCLF